MMIHLCSTLSSAILVGFLVSACQAKAPTPQQPLVLKDTVGNRLVLQDTTRVPSSRDTARIIASFTDTATVRVTPAQAHTFELRASGQRDALRTTLRQERVQWRSINPRDYEYLLRVDCFCPGRRGWLLMEVRENEPLRAWDMTAKSAAITDWNTFSIEALFDMLEHFVDVDGVVQVAFDRRWHYPAYIRTIRRPGPDTWSIIDARGFRPLPER